jgi:hypothetical protein
VEYIKDGIREESGAGIQNHLPRAAVGSQGRAAVIWHNASDANIEVIEYEFSTSAWLPQETLESRSRQIPGGNTHQLASNDNGDLLAAWGDRFTVKPSGDASWARSKSLADAATHLGIDERAQPYSIHIAGADVIASRYIGGTWISQSLNEAVDVAAKTILSAGAGVTDALLVHWLSGPSLLFSSDQPGEPAPPGNTPPIANAGTAQTVFESTSVQLDGSASYDPEGVIASFAWEQVSGSLVSLSGATTPQPGFVAPTLSVEEDLVFRLLVTDQQGLSDSATVTIRVLDDAPDTTPPVTTFVTQTRRVKGAKMHTITLQSNETATTYFRFIGQGVISAGGADTPSWQTYTQAVVIQLDKSGSGDFEFYSEDFAGNLESTQLEILQ